jgi:FKBP-type peptidyl-prolyl cis-trans isomerase
MIFKKRIRLVAPIALLSFLAALGFAQSSITGVQLSYKRDSRVVDPFRGIGVWASGPRYAGALAQDTVEVRAQGVGAEGKPVRISPEWVPSDPEMVTISPSQGEDVNITVHRPGESKLRISAEGFSMELEIKAKHVGEGRFMAFEISPIAPVKPNEPTASKAPVFKTRKEQLSYAAGMDLAKALEQQSLDVEADAVMKGFRDFAAGSKTLMTEEEASAALHGVQLDPRVLRLNLDRKGLADKNKREGEAFLAENRRKKGVVSLPSGLQYKVLKAGHGKKPGPDDVVSVEYRVGLIDGNEFDSGSTKFPVKAVIKGWQEALQLMPVGSKWQLFVPPELAYGERGAGRAGGRRRGRQGQVIGPNATVIFEVALLSIKDDPSATAAVAGSKESGQARP